MTTTKTPAPVLHDTTLYLGDNGRCLCGACSGVSARYTGRDLSGQPVEAITPQTLAEYPPADDFRCEDCGLAPSRLWP